MTRPDRSPRPGEAGFVLIGVVIFVLALTIIGMSLFSLSSYEAQFLQRSIDGEQAFQSAVGGIERAKFALAQTSLLQSVKQNLPEGVDSTVAIQDDQEDGHVIWQATDVITIRVIAEVNGARCTIEGLFTPVDSLALSYYSPLLTVSEGIEVEIESTTWPPNRDSTVWLDGTVWESSPQDPDEWKRHLHPPAPDVILKSPAVHGPDVGPFLTPGQIDAALPVEKFVPPPPGNPTYILNASGPPGVPAYFRSPDGSNPDFFDSSPSSSCPIQVQGLAVWLIPHGARFWQGTVITGNPNPNPNTDCLVIIAGDEGITFWGKLEALIPVILVSSGQVTIFHGNEGTYSSSTVDVSIFARSAKFMGPADPTNPTDPPVLALHRYPDGPLNTVGGNPGLLAALARHGALPNASSGGRRLDLVPGTWHASDR